MNLKKIFFFFLANLWLIPFWNVIFLQGTMLQSIERYMKQAIVDKIYSVSSAALSSSLVSFVKSCVFLPNKTSCSNHNWPTFSGVKISSFFDVVDNN